MCSSDPPPPPDYSGIAASNTESAKIAKESADADLAFRMKVYDESKPRQQQLQDLATRVAENDMSISNKNQAFADEQQQYYKQAYQPNEMQTIADAYGSQYLTDEENKYLSDIMSGKSGFDAGKAQLEMAKMGRVAENRAGEKAATKAYADEGSAAAQAQRSVARMGLNPDRVAAITAGLQNQNTAARIGAGNAARDTVRGQLSGMRTGVANFGRNMPNTAGQAFGLATQAGSQAVSNGATGFQAGLPYAQFAAGGYGGQMGAAALQQQGALGMGGLMSRDYGTAVGASNAANASNASGLAGLGSLAGAGISAYGKYAGTAALIAASDRSVKEDLVLVGVRADGIPIYAFTYKEPYRDQWGHGRQMGVLADDVERVYPDAVSIHSDGYKLVNYSMLGA